MVMDFLKIVDAWVRENREVLDELSGAQRRAIGVIASGTAADDALRAAGDEFVLGVKSTGLVRRTGLVMERVEDGKNKYGIPWVLSEEKVDRAGDLIIQNGWQLENFKRNPVLLWGHAMGADSDADVPIGRVDNVRVEGTKLLGECVFAVEEYERAAQIWRLVKAGIVRAGSVGFRPLKVNHIVDEAERNSLGLGRYGVVFEKQELLEFSPCAVPCLPSALSDGVKSGRIKSSDADLVNSFQAQTERDLVKLVRRRARGFIAPGAAPIEEGRGIRPEGEEGGAHLRDLADAIRELAAAREDDVASRRMLARAISDLRDSLGATRAVDSARPVADAERERGGQLSDLTNKLEELKKLLNRRN